MSTLSRRQFLAASAAASGALLLPGCATGGPQAAAPGPMFHPITLAAGPGSAALAHQVGFDGLVCTASVLLPDKPEAAFADAAAALRALPLPVLGINQLLPSSLRVTGPQADHDAVVRRVAVVFARARQLGIRRVIFGSGGARQVPEGFPMQEARGQFTSLLKRLAPMAAAADLLLIPETLNRGECNFINRLPELTAMVAEVNHPAVRINADLYHLRREGEDPAVLAEAVPWLGLMEIAEKEGRTVPGVKGDDFRPFFKVLARAGWSGPLGVEGAGSSAAEYAQMFRTLDEQVRDARA